MVVSVEGSDRWGEPLSGAELFATESFGSRLSRRDGITWLALGGELDVFTAPTLREAIEEAAPAGSENLVLDLRGLSFLDSSGLAVILAAHERLGGTDEGELRLVIQRLGAGRGPVRDDRGRRVPEPHRRSQRPQRRRRRIARLRRSDCSGPGIRRRGTGEGFRIPRRGRRADHRHGDGRAPRRTAGATGLEGRLDLLRSDGPPPGHRDRRCGPQAVPLPPALAPAPRRSRSSTRCWTSRTPCPDCAAGWARTSRAARRSPPGRRFSHAECDCSTVASSASAARTTRRRTRRTGSPPSTART